MAQDNSRYHRGALYRTLTEAILNASMEKFVGRAPDSIVAADLATLKAAVDEWFSQNVVARCYTVPCSLMPNLSGFQAVFDRPGHLPARLRLFKDAKF